MAFEVTVLRDIKTREIISRSIKEIDAVVNDRPLVELILKNWEESK